MADKTTEIADAVKTEEQKVESSKQGTDVKATSEDKSVAENKVTDKKEESFDDFITRVLASEKELSDEDEDKLYNLLIDEVKIADAKLSTKQRKSLSKSTFCGPNRSFPVPDCAHVTAARRLIGRYKGPGDKTKILACVSRKAKAMGCDSKGSKDSLDHARVLHMLTAALEEHLYSKGRISSDGELKDPTLSEEDVSAVTGVLKRLAVMVGKDNFITALNGSDKELKDIIKHFQDVDLLGEIVSLEEKLGILRDELAETVNSRDALREEYALLQEDVNSVRDEFVKEKVKFKNMKVQYLDLMTSLKDAKVDAERSKLLENLTDDILEVEVLKLAKEVDIKKITDKLGDGTTRIPVGNVEDPTLKLEDKKEKVDTEKVKQELKMVEDRYMELLLKSPAEAERWRQYWVEKMKREGKLPIKE